MSKRLRNFLIAFVGIIFSIIFGYALAVETNQYNRTQYVNIQSINNPVTQNPSNTQALTPIQNIKELNSCLPDNAKVEKAKVLRIIDGDTIEVDLAGTKFSLRYIGIDTPERDNPFGLEASTRNSELIAGKDVTLVKDVSETDNFKRLLRYVFLGNIFINEILIREGFATAKSYPPDTACQAVFSAAQAESKTQNRGVWLATQIPDSNTEFCPQGCLEKKPGCEIKGNINNDGEKIYHEPGSNNYTSTIIDPSKGERWFCTVDEAKENGWKSSRN